MRLEVSVVKSLRQGTATLLRPGYWMLRMVGTMSLDEHALPIRGMTWRRKITGINQGIATNGFYVGIKEFERERKKGMAPELP